MSLPFLAIVSIFVPQVPSGSMKETLSPSLGLAGSVIVKAPPLVSARMLSSANAV